MGPIELTTLTNHPSRPTLTPPTELRALRIAPRARAALRDGSNWKLLSSHRRALNFIDAAGRLLSLTQERIRMGPFSIEVESIPPGPTFDDRAQPITMAMVAEARVQRGGLTIDLTSAANWDPQPGWPRLAAIPWQSDFLPLLLNRLRASAPPESLACVLSDQSLLTLHPRDRGLAGGSKSSGRLQELPQSAAAQFATRLVQEVAARDHHAAASAAAALAGMGSGLTPSGDDFLIGVMFGVQSAMSSVDAMAFTHVLYRSSIGRTNRISEAWLSAAAEGEAIQAWHDLVDGLSFSSLRSVDQACCALIRLGHTSGADALAGFVAFHSARFSSRTI